MPRFTKTSLDELRNKVNILDITQEFTQCPFCEGTWSRVYIENNKFCCNSCKFQGDAFQILMCHKKMTFVEAIYFLAGKYDVKMEIMEDKPLFSPEDKEELTNIALKILIAKLRFDFETNIGKIEGILKHNEDI